MLFLLFIRFLYFTSSIPSHRPRSLNNTTTNTPHPQSALLAGVLTSTGSWPSILPSGELSPWPIRTTWYCGIVLSLFSILTAADQTVRLHRLSSHRDGLANLRKLLGKRVRRGKRRDVERADVRVQMQMQRRVDIDLNVDIERGEGQPETTQGTQQEGKDILQPGLLQVVTWQMPVMFLTSATLCMIVGLFLHIWSATPEVGGMVSWNDDSKVGLGVGRKWEGDELTEDRLL